MGFVILHHKINRCTAGLAPSTLPNVPLYSVQSELPLQSQCEHSASRRANRPRRIHVLLLRTIILITLSHSHLQLVQLTRTQQ